MTRGDGTGTRDGATLELAVAAGQHVDCVTAPFDISAGVFIEVSSVTLTSSDAAYMSVTSASQILFGLQLNNAQLTVYDNCGFSHGVVVTGPATRWMRFVPNGANTLAAEGSPDGEHWVGVGSLMDPNIDITQPFAVDFGAFASTALTGTRSIHFDNFDVCPP